MKWLGQYIQSFTARFRSDVYLEHGADLYITDATDSGDYFKIETTTHGATTLTTVDDDATAANFEIAADGNITLDSANDISLEITDARTISFVNGTNTFGRLYAEDGNNSEFRLNEQGGSSNHDYFSISVEEHGDTTLGTVDTAGTSAHMKLDADGTITLDSVGGQTLSDSTGAFRFIDADNLNDYFQVDIGSNGDTTLTTVDANAALANFEIAADGDITLDAAGQIKLEPVSGNNILLDGTVTVDGGSVTGITTLGVDSVELTAVQTSGESFSNDDVSLMTSAAIEDKIQAHYSYQYMNFSFKVTTYAEHTWVSPHANGIEYYLWGNQNVYATSGTTQVASHSPVNVTSGSTLSIDYLDQGTSGLTIPIASQFVGFRGNIKTNNTDPDEARPVMGFFRAAEPSDRNNSDVTATVISFDKYDTSSGVNMKNKFLGLSETLGSPVSLAAGDIIFPAVGLDSDMNDTSGQIWGNFTIILRTLIP